MLKQLGCVIAISLAGMQAAAADVLAGTFNPGPIPADCFGLQDFFLFQSQPVSILFDKNGEQNTTIWGAAAGHPAVLHIDMVPTTVTVKGKATLIGLKKQSGAVNMRLKHLRIRPDSLEASLNLFNMLGVGACDVGGKIVMLRLP